MLLTDPGRSVSWLVGAHRSSRATPKNAVTWGDVQTFHTQLGFICFSSKNHKQMIFEEAILKPNGEFEPAEEEVGHCQVDGRDEAHPTCVSFVWISSFLPMMMFQ